MRRRRRSKRSLRVGHLCRVGAPYGRAQRRPPHEAYSFAARPSPGSSTGTHFRNVSALQPIFDAIEAIALHWESYSLWCSNTIRTARSRTSGEYLLGLPMMTPILSSNGVSGKPEEVQDLLSEVGGVAIKPFLKEFWDGSSNRPQVFPKSSPIDVDFMCRVRMVVCFVSFAPSELE